MNSFFDYLTKIINIINPVLLFMVLVSVISFLGYLKIKIEEYFKDIKSISNSLERIADSEDSKRNGYYS